MSLAADLCLLGIEPASGKPAFARSQRDLVLGAALVAELEQRGLILVEGLDAAAVVRPTADRPDLVDPVLAAAADRARSRPRTVLPLLVAEVGDGVWRRQVTLLVEDGCVEVVRRLPSRRYGVRDQAARAAVVSRARRALLGPEAPERAMRGLLGLLGATGRLSLVASAGEVDRARAAVVALGPDPVVASYVEASWVTSAPWGRVSSGIGS